MVSMKLPTIASRCALMIANAALAIHPAAAADTVILGPAGPWNINYDTDSCQLARTFGAGKDQVLLQMQTYNMSSIYTVMVAGQAFKLKKPIMLDEGPRKQKYLGEKPNEFKGKFVYQFGPAGGLQAGWTRGAMIQAAGEADPVPALLVGGLSLAGTRSTQDQSDWTTPKNLVLPDLALEAALNWFLVRNPEGKGVKLNTGSLAQPIAALRSCSLDLVKSWGIAVDDPDLAPVVSPVPTSNPGTWVTSNDFPSKELFAKTNAIIRFRIMVDAAGKSTSCKIQDETRNSELAAVTCRLMMQRSSFSPARNAAGLPVPGYYTNAISWVTPH